MANYNQRSLSDEDSEDDDFPQESNYSSSNPSRKRENSNSDFNDGYPTKPKRRNRVSSYSTTVSNSTETQSMSSDDEDGGNSSSHGDYMRAEDHSSSLNDYSDNAQNMMKGMGFEVGAGLGKFNQGQEYPEKDGNHRGNGGLGFESESESSTLDVNSGPSSYSGAAQNMMKSMGYEKGGGLGKFKQGRVAPVEASNQRGRRGFGFSIDGLDADRNIEWDAEQEFIQVEEDVMWLPYCPEDPPDTDTLYSWCSEGTRKLDITDESNFCDQRLLDRVLGAKTIFDKLDEKELVKARTRSNPFETLGKLFFQNRAALKMANLDTVFDFMFTRPVDENKHSSVLPDELLYFADVCAAPGGFSEYVLWKRKNDCNGFCEAKGFGFTLKENDFKLHDFFAAPSEFFEPHYGVSGKDGDGDIYVPKNIKTFRDFVLSSTGGLGVHFMMADGGFSVEGQENIQEILSKRLYLCQFLVGIGIVRSGGHFVCKLFDLFTTFSVGLVYLMHRCFKYVSIHKPNTSRPANSERYIICKWRRENIDDVYSYLFDINERLDGFGTMAKMDMMELVPLEFLKEEKDFYDYICHSNNSLAHHQIIGLSKIKAFAQNTELIETKQAELRSDSLKYWELPDRSRIAPHRTEPKLKFKDLLLPETQEVFKTGPTNLTLPLMKEKIHSPYDYRAVLLSSNKDGRKDRSFFMGMGGCYVLKWDGRANSAWIKVDSNIQLPPDTLIYGELVTEHKGEWKAQRKLTTLHLIDGIVLNGFNIRDLHLVERHSYLKKFALAINKPSRNDLAPIRCKQLFKLEDLSTFLCQPRIQMRQMKGSNVRRVFCETGGLVDKNTPMTIPSGVMLLKQTQLPWMMAFSKTQGRKYWYHTIKKEATYECKQEVIAPFKHTYTEGLLWWWDFGVQILQGDEAEPNRLHLRTLQDYLNELR